MRIKDAWNKWRYLGYDRETTVRYRPESDRANLRTLKRISVISLLITVPLTLTFSFFLHQRIGALISAITFAFMMGVFFLCRSMLSGALQKKTRAANWLVLLVSLSVYALGIYSGVGANKGELSVVAIWLFLLVQICFDLPPLQNALTVLSCAALFAVLTCLTKPAPKCYYDVLYAYCSIVVGLYVSHHQTRLALDNIIAKNCLTEANFALYHTCTTDELTGLSNRRMVFERFDAVLERCVADGLDVACVVLDIDDYKQFNDTYGHPEGDALLKRIGQTLSAYGLEHGIDIGRIGGEEFLAVWAESSRTNCISVADDLRAAIERMGIPHRTASDHPIVTFSVGLCMLPPASARRAYFFADKALYRAKDAGKNCCCLYDAETGEYQLISSSHSTAAR
ncbi:MAG TPA: diguanylate cyclase [Candidatus Cryosericum sp.]|nr:diguanylate cyclase [Candidatus Cryosericum sp.]